MKGDMRGTVRDLRDTLEEVDVAAGVSDETEAEEPEAPATKDGNELLAESQEWQNAAGKSIVAAIRGVSDGKVEFVMPDGRSLPYPLANLSAESQERIKALVAD